MTELSLEANIHRPRRDRAPQDGPPTPSVLREARVVESRTTQESKEARQIPGLFT